MIYSGSHQRSRHNYSVLSPPITLKLISCAALGFVFLSGCSRVSLPPQQQKLSENRLLRRKLRAIYPLYAQHRITEATAAYLSAAEQSIQRHDYESASKLLLNAGGCQLAIFRYQDAYGTMERARQAANRTGDHDVIAMANANIATLYLQMNNNSGAAQAADRALAMLREGHPQFARVIIPIAQVRAEQNDLVHAEPLLRRAIDAAYRSGKLIQPLGRGIIWATATHWRTVFPKPIARSPNRCGFEKCSIWRI